jgi:4-hydroxybenzoyl-CoA reductase beta subunit
MSLLRFDYIAPKTVERAVSLQTLEGRFLGGGTDLFVALKQKLFRVKSLVDLNAIPSLKRIEWDEKKGLSLGGLATLTRVGENGVVRKNLPVLSQAVEKVGTPQLRNMGTIAGNLCLETRCLYHNQPALLKKRWDRCLKAGGTVCHAVRGSDACHAVYSGDMAILLLALEACVEVAGPAGRKEMPLEKFFSGSGVKPNILDFNEVLTKVLIPRLPPRSGVSYQKLRLRDTMDFALASVAAYVRLAEDDTCADFRLVIGGVAPSPIIEHQELWTQQFLAFLNEGRDHLTVIPYHTVMCYREDIGFRILVYDHDVLCPPHAGDVLTRA